MLMTNIQNIKVPILRRICETLNCIRQAKWSLLKNLACDNAGLPVRSYSSTISVDTRVTVSDIPVEDIRNFSIIAHVDHGKSTLADRLLEMAGVVTRDSGQHQILDRLQVERERGITVKAQTASLVYTLAGRSYLLNLIDTPGHVDFANEVSRSLSACQGVVLLVDANEGVQAQTVANFYLAFGKDLVIIPVLNKVDLKNADPERVADQMQTLFDFNKNDILKISAKFGTGVENVIHAIIERLPPPTADRSAPFRALLFDSWYDRYRGAVALVYVTDGSVKVGDRVVSVHSGKNYEVRDVGILRPHEEPTNQLLAGQVGYVTCNMRSTKEAHIGDTLHLKDCVVAPLPGFRPARPMVFAGVYPTDQSQHQTLRAAIDKLVLNDSAVSVATESSPALGQGWRLGFLGLLHMEVFTQRLDQEFDAQAIITAPSVPYKATIFGEKNIKKYGKSELVISNPAHFPDPTIVSEFFEPMVLGTIITPDKYLGSITKLCMEKRGVKKNSTYIDNERVMMQFILPLNEVVVDFHDILKSVSSGYASFDYEDHDYVPSKLVKSIKCSVEHTAWEPLAWTVFISERESLLQLNILLNSVVVEELATIVHISKAYSTARQVCLKLKDTIPRQMIQISIQGAVQGKVIARETLQAYRKDVAAKLYGGDVTRRMKLLKQQAEGKKKMKRIANIELPHKTFIDVLKR